MKTFLPPRPPSVGSGFNPSRRSTARDAANGNVENVPGSVLVVRQWDLTWNQAPEELMQYVFSFFSSMAGIDEAFWWTPPMDVANPADGPVLTTVADGALGQNTYHIAYSWFGDGGSMETKISEYLTIFKGLNFVIVAQVPVWPHPEVEGFRLYEQTLGKIAEVNAGVVWQQSSASPLAGIGGTPAAANNFRAPVKWRLLNEFPKFTPRGGCIWDVSFSIVEQVY